MAKGIGTWLIAVGIVALFPAGAWGLTPEEYRTLVVQGQSHDQISALRGRAAANLALSKLQASGLKRIENIVVWRNTFLHDESRAAFAHDLAGRFPDNNVRLTGPRPGFSHLNSVEEWPEHMIGWTLRSDLDGVRRSEALDAATWILHGWVRGERHDKVPSLVNVPVPPVGVAPNVVSTEEIVFPPVAGATQFHLNIDAYVAERVPKSLQAPHLNSKIFIDDGGAGGGAGISCTSGFFRSVSGKQSA